MIGQHAPQSTLRSSLARIEVDDEVYLYGIDCQEDSNLEEMMFLEDNVESSLRAAAGTCGGCVKKKGTCNPACGS